MRELLLLLCVCLLLMQPMAALAAEGGLEDYIGPDAGIWWSFLLVAIAITLDTLFGILLGIKNGELDPRLLPQFVLTGVLPFLGGLLVLAILAYYTGPAFEGMFFAAVAAIAAKYSKDIWDKLKLLFGAIPKA